MDVCLCQIEVNSKEFFLTTQLAKDVNNSETFVSVNIMLITRTMDIHTFQSLVLTIGYRIRHPSSNQSGLR